MKMKTKKHSQAWMIARRLLKNKLSIIGMCIIILLLIVVIFADQIAPYDYAMQDYNNILQGPSREHLCGTDSLGRDILSRLIFGTRQSLRIGVLSVAIAATIGIFMGSIAGYYGGKVDNLFMRFLDIYQSIPYMVMMIALAAVLGPGLNNAILAIGITTIAGYARLMRASILTIRSKEYIEGARAIDAGDWRILRKYIIPNAIAPLIIEVTMSIGSSILCAATLSFIGLGAQPPIPEWGAMLSAGRSYMRDYGYLVIFPGLLIMITVLSFNLLGDGLRDALDPRLKN